jgi:precorrin-6B methylase 2
MAEFDHGIGAAEYWNRRSKTFHCSCWKSTYDEELISRMDLRPEYSVLDVGCGCGAMAIPLALKVNRVTALDISSIRLEKLLKRAAAVGLTNIIPVNQDWNQVRVGREINKHDVVLLSRCVHARLSETLQKINQAAKSACYITWRAYRKDEFEDQLAEAMEKNQPLYPDYLIICKTLWRMGIPARMEIFETLDEEKYSNLEEAVLSMARGAEINGRQYASLLEVTRKHFKMVDNFYSSFRKIKWALISWEH